MLHEVIFFNGHKINAKYCHFARFTKELHMIERTLEGNPRMEQNVYVNIFMSCRNLQLRIQVTNFHGRKNPMFYQQNIQRIVKCYLFNASIRAFKYSMKLQTKNFQIIIFFIK